MKYLIAIVLGSILVGCQGVSTNKPVYNTHPTLSHYEGGSNIVEDKPNLYDER